MKTVFLAAGFLVVAFTQSPVIGQGRGGGGGGNTESCPTISISIADDQSGITSDGGGSYGGTLFGCGTGDMVVNSGDKNRSFSLNLDGRIPGSYPPEQYAWLTGVQPFKGQFNVHKLGQIREAGVPTTTWMTATIGAADRKTYRLRMTPFETDMGTEILGEQVNEPYETSPATVTFIPGCAACPGNPFGKWDVVGDVVRTDELTGASYVQVATIYRVGNTWIKMGQFQLPFRMTVTLTSPLPAQ
jgi:hypothetical protein